MTKISDFFQKYGITKKDIPKSLIYFKTLSLLSYLSCIMICYKYRPLIRIFKGSNFLEQIKLRYPIGYHKYYNFVINKSTKLSESKYFKPIPSALRLNSNKLTTAIAENIIFSKLLLPITVPVQFWIIVNIMKTHNIEYSSMECISERIVDNYEIINSDTDE